MAYDLVIRDGTLIDGTGSAPRAGDVALQDGRIAAVGQVSDPAARTLDADGLAVTPGFVDIHTHYDGQATWDPQLAPSCYHGVTTAVMGNCGVGFAPVRPDQHDFLIQLMEGVEDIPGAALARGHAVGVGDLPRVPRRARAAPLQHGPRHAGAARRGARVRDGRARREQRARDAGRHRADGRDREAGRRRGRARLLDLAHDRAPRDLG